MFLRRITVSGFKSFCDRVDFDFGPGVTCIVGPNGCGKSNVVDAFKWVLGEQSARSLRGRQMIDMIFNGSSSRRSSSVAQVDLVFDNADRALPLDLDEVTVSRKLYRSGESEYLLNQNVTRLKDVRELFMDTGVGVDAYSVIEQGRVDQLLQSSPQDRRIIFEEAAGISKYKARRREAERKLERTDQNLLRVADIIEEVEKRLRSVKLQAAKARNFQEYETRLKALRARFVLAEFHRFSVEAERLTREVSTCQDRATALRTAMDRHEKDESQLTLQLDRLAEEINAADNELVRARAESAAQQERIEGATRRLHEQQALLTRTGERLEGDHRRREESRAELARVQASAEALQRETQALHTRTDELNEQDRALARDLAEGQAILEDEKAGVIDLLRKSAQVHNEIIRLNTHRESLVGQKGRLSQRDAQIRAELEMCLEQKAQLERRRAEIDALIADQSRQLETKKEESGRINALRQQLIDQLAGTKEERSALHSRHDLLSDLQRKLDGVGAGVRSLLDRRAEPDTPPALSELIGLLADIIDVDVEHAAIIEAALGDADQLLLFSHSGSFLADRAAVSNLPGRLTLLGEDRLPPLLSERPLNEHPGLIGRALDLVRFDPRHERLVRHLLGRVLVVEDLPTALTLAHEDAGRYRFVTRRGEVVEPDGRISLGPPASEAGLISRKSELRDIDRRLTEVDELITTLSDRLNRTQAEATHNEEVQQELRTAIYETSTARVEANAALQSIAETVERLTREQPLIAQEVSLIEQQINDVHRRSEEGGQSLEAIEAENKRREEEIARHQARIDDVVARRRDVQEQLTQARVQAGQLAEKRAAAAETINALRKTAHELDAAIQSAEQEIEHGKARIEEAESTIRHGQEALARLAGEIERQETRCADLRHQREAIRTELSGIAQALRAARGELNEVESALHGHQMTLTETTVRRDELSTRTLDELGINLAEHYEGYQPEEEDWAAVEAEITELRRKMERLGHVNLDAITELDELETRHAFLTGQRDDLAESRRQLEQLIERLNEESQERFRRAFDQIRENFRTLFRKLFGGGRADIVLEDQANVLECGIDIVAQPPGKELQSISLMSGGEKSMTAIALLMSIFKTRPAPFAILDEVDAALDEANNDRFNRIVREFVAESQFIVITHSKRTMGIGDQLYGITMQEPGVSTRVSVDFREVGAA